MKRLAWFLASAFGLLLAVMIVNALRIDDRVVAVAPDRPALDSQAIAQRLAAALAIPTTSDQASIAPFLNLHALLQTQFPRVHAHLERETINEASLLFRWPGRNDCPAMLLGAHQDVVPIEPGSESTWHYPPFAGTVAEGAIWGRGAIDDKASLMAILEAVEMRLAEGFAPECDVWLAFGHDEETGGEQGAKAIARTLKARGVQLAFVLDEGGAITSGAIPGTKRPLATIGVAEKGYVSLRLSAHDHGGHSSMPPRHTAIGRLARAVARLEEHRPAAGLSPVQRELLRRVAAHVSPLQRLVLANLWISAPLVERQLAVSPASDATMRTTTAPTMFHAGIKDNVLAQQAEAVVNFRIRVGERIEDVLAHARHTIDDAAIDIEIVDGFQSEASPISPWNDPAFERIELVLRSVSPESDLVVAPYVTSGGTDARHYVELTPRLYRFLAVHLSPELLASFHGNNERIPIAEYERLVRFYRRLLDSAPAANQRQS